MKATAVAPANIAFIKYWGKKNKVLRLPINSSISMNLSGLCTTTSVEFSSTFIEDSVELIGDNFSVSEINRVKKSLDLIRKRAGIHEYADVVTKNTFPKGAGAAASASGFAALTLAGFAAAGVSLTEKELTIFARLGSGSACRSIPDGFVLWKEGETSEESFAYSLYPSTYWDIRDILVIVDASMKKVSTTKGMEDVHTSPLLVGRLEVLPGRVKRVEQTLKDKDFSSLGEVVEEDCLDMHAVMQSQNPPIYYWNEMTKKIMASVVGWRAGGLPVYFTIDAGPNVHILCEGKNAERVMEKAKLLDSIQSIIMNKPSQGAHLLS